MGELRERMQQALILHGMAPRTQEAYLAAVRGLAKYYHQRPDTLREAQLQVYIRFLIEERHLSASSVRVAVMGLRFFIRKPYTNPGPMSPYPNDQDLARSAQSRRGRAAAGQYDQRAPARTADDHLWRRAARQRGRAPPSQRH